MLDAATGACISCDDTDKKKPSDERAKYIPSNDCNYEIGKKKPARM